MGTTIQKTTNLKYTDSSEKFKEGMTREEAKDVRDWGGIFSEDIAIKKFNRIDKDLDGVLSHDEISDEIREDVKANKRAGYTAIGFAALFGLTAKYAKNKHLNHRVPLGFGIIQLGLAAYDLYKISKLQKRIAQGHN